MSTKKPKLACGRPKTTDEITELHLARAHWESGLTYAEVARTFGIARSSLIAKLMALKTRNPELVQFFQGLRENSTELTTKEEVLEQVLKREEVKTATQLTDSLVIIKQNLADRIEETVGLLLDMKPIELQAMKTEHKIKLKQIKGVM